MSTDLLLSSVVPAVFAAPGVYDIHAFFIICLFYLLFYSACGRILPSFSATYAKWKSESRGPASCDDGSRKAIKEDPIKEMRRFRLYVGSTLNCCICIAIAIFMVTHGYFVAPSAVSSACTRLCCWCLSGYFVADMLLGLPDANEYPSELIHHLFGLPLVSSFLVAEPTLQYTIAPYGFWFFISESSTIPLNIIYILEKSASPKRASNAGGSQEPAAAASQQQQVQAPAATTIYILQRLFLLLFVVFRVVLMPAFAGVHLSFMSQVPFSAGFLFAATSCWALSLLQFYFFGIIIQRIREETGKVRPAAFI